MIKIVAETTPKDFESALKVEMEKPLDHFKKELVKIRTGRASTSMIESIKVICYGSEMPLSQIASLSAPEPRLLVIQPWDKSVIADIEKGLLESDLGVTPLNDGDIIRITLPQMSGSRREELSKILNKKLEECRIAIRNIRKDFQNAVRDLEKDKKFSIDYSKRLLATLQEFTDKYVANAEEMSAKKEKEIKFD